MHMEMRQIARNNSGSNFHRALFIRTKISRRVETSIRPRLIQRAADNNYQLLLQSNSLVGYGYTTILITRRASMLADSYSCTTERLVKFYARRAARTRYRRLSQFIRQLPVDANSPISIREFCGVMVQSEA